MALNKQFRKKLSFEISPVKDIEQKKKRGNAILLKERNDPCLTKY